MLAFYIASLDTEAERIKIAEIYDEHKPVMLRYALVISKNKEIAEDAVHNAFLAVIKHKESYFQLDSMDLRNKLIIITKNKCVDIMRQRNKYVDEPVDEMDDVLVSKELPVEDKIIQSDEYDTIKRYVASLDEASRVVLEMKYLLDMTYKEIGVELGISPKHVDTRIMRAKEKVRRLIAEGGESIEQ